MQWVMGSYGEAAWCPVQEGGGVALVSFLPVYSVPESLPLTTRVIVQSVPSKKIDTSLSQTSAVVINLGSRTACSNLPLMGDFTQLT